MKYSLLKLMMINDFYYGFLIVFVFRLYYEFLCFLNPY